MPASQLNNVGLTYNWETGENLWGDPLNSNLGKIDALLQSSVEDTITVLPGSPLDGQMWLVADSGTTGSLIGHENKLAIYYDGAFNFITPKEGWEISHKTKKTRLRRNSSNKWESAQSSFVTDNISTLITIPTPVLPSGKTVEIDVISYHPNWSGSSTIPLGGGRFVWDATKPKSQHNGGTIISPTVPWDGTQASHAAFLAGTGETAPTGNGCWIRVSNEGMHASFFGMSSLIANNGPSLQKALDVARGVIVNVEKGAYVFTSGVVYDTSGDGVVDGLKIIGAGRQDTLLDNRTGGVLITATSGTSSSDFQRDVRFLDFSITNTTASASTIGIKLIGVNGGTIGPRIVNQASHGMWLESTVNDATDVFNVSFYGGEYSSNGGYGIYANADLSGVHANNDFYNNRLIGNTLGGIIGYSLTSCRFGLNAYAYNNGPGLTITKRATGSYSRNIEVEGTEEYDTNDGNQILIDGVANATIYHPYLVANSGLPQVFATGIRFRDCFNVIVNNAMPRIASGLTGITLFQIESTSQRTHINNTEYSSWISSGNTVYNDAGTLTSILEAKDVTQTKTWTPIDASGASLTFTSATGTYSRSGRIVTANCEITYPTTSDTSNLAIGGLPFTVNENAVGGLLSGGANIGDVPFAPTGSTQIFIYAQSFNRRTNANYSGVTLYVTVTYQTN